MVKRIENLPDFMNKITDRTMNRSRYVFLSSRTRRNLKPGLHCYTTFTDPTMLERLAPMFARHFLLDERLISCQTFVQQKMSQTRVLNVPTLLDKQMLYNNVGTCSPNLTAKVCLALRVTFPELFMQVACFCSDL